MNCINCHHEVNSNYCPNCGQRSSVKRITFREGWNDFWARIYGFDGMFPRTLRDLTIRPGYATRIFIGGNRVQYYGPVGYFFLMITLFLLIVSFTGKDFNEFLLKNSSKYSPQITGDGQKQFMQAIVGFISDNIKLISFMAIPIEAFCARYIFFRRSGLNFLENMVLPFYLRGHVYWLSILAFLVYVFTSSTAFYTSIAVITVFYFGLGYSSLIDYQPKWKSFLKGIGIVLTGQVIFMTIMFAAVFVLIALSPELLEMVRPSNNK